MTHVCGAARSQREKPGDGSVALKGDDRQKTERNNEAARPPKISESLGAYPRSHAEEGPQHGLALDPLSLPADLQTALEDNFREMAAPELDRFRREIIERTGGRRQAENLSDAGIPRDVMNTVAKEAQLGEPIRCVVAVSMLTEGWDAESSAYAPTSRTIT